VDLKQELLGLLSFFENQEWTASSIDKENEAVNKGRNFQQVRENLDSTKK